MTGFHDCRAFRPAPSKLTRSPRRLFQTISSRSVKRARSEHGSTRGQPRGLVAIPIHRLKIAEPHRGPIQAREVGNGGVRVLTGSNVPNVGFVAAPLVTLVPSWPPFGP